MEEEVVDTLLVFGTTKELRTHAGHLLGSVVGSCRPPQNEKETNPIVDHIPLSPCLWVATWETERTSSVIESVDDCRMQLGSIGVTVASAVAASRDHDSSVKVSGCRAA